MSFHCQQCGNCCRVPGTVHIASDEAGAIASFLSMEVYAFTETYTRLDDSRTRLVLLEQPDGACIMLTSDNGCRINSVKPQQCRDFPSGWRTPATVAACPALKVGRQEGRRLKGFRCPSSTFNLSTFDLPVVHYRFYETSLYIFFS